MSGRKDIDLRTQDSIFLQGADLSTDRTVRFRCGCEQRGAKWWLCQYHEGFEDAIDVLQYEKDKL